MYTILLNLFNNSSMILEPLLKLLIATIIGGIIGLQRQNQHKPAGIKTHILVCISSTLIMLTSLHFAKLYPNVDPSRLGAQVISGIGFLCAGTILRDGSSIHGLTTAASVWAVACLGLAIGAGDYITAVTTSILIFIVLIISDTFLEEIEYKTRETTKFTLICNESIELIEKVQKILDEEELNILSIKINNLPKNSFCEIVITTDFINNTNRKKIIDTIYQLENIIKVI